MGFVASTLAFLIGFVPPSQFGDNSTGSYIVLVLTGIVVIGLLPPLLLLWRRKPSWKQAEADS